MASNLSAAAVGKRRTPGDRQRRQNLADAASGIERFRVLVYLCTAANADPAPARQECTEYADMFGWEVVDVIEDRTGLLPPQGRDGLSEALDRIRAKEAGALLTAYRSMISPRSDEYDAVSTEVEKAGGFLHVINRVPLGPTFE
jgi:hypothetical protein